MGRISFYLNTLLPNLTTQKVIGLKRMGEKGSQINYCGFPTIVLCNFFNKSRDDYVVSTNDTKTFQPEGMSRLVL